MPELRSSLASAIYMASQIDLAQGSVHVRVEPIRAAYFRAALAEIVRVEDACKVYGRTLSFKHSSDPLLHIVKLLRNYEVHIGSLTLAAGTIRVRWGEDEGIHESFIVDNLSVAPLKQLDSASGYTDFQLGELLEIFDMQQRRFGVVQLLYNTVLHVAKLLSEA